MASPSNWLPMIPLRKVTRENLSVFRPNFARNAKPDRIGFRRLDLSPSIRRNRPDTKRIDGLNLKVSEEQQGFSREGCMSK